MRFMRKSFALVTLFLATFLAHGQYYQAADLTAENLFTGNIEGPNVDKKGNLYVVNFQKDGTIGVVNKRGKVKLFVTLPEGSTANAIMFDANENLLLADFTGHNVLKVNKKNKSSFRLLS